LEKWRKNPGKGHFWKSGAKPPGKEFVFNLVKYFLLDFAPLFLKVDLVKYFLLDFAPLFLKVDLVKYFLLDFAPLFLKVDLHHFFLKSG